MLDKVAESRATLEEVRDVRLRAARGGAHKLHWLPCR